MSVTPPPLSTGAAAAATAGQLTLTLVTTSVLSQPSTSSAPSVGFISSQTRQLGGAIAGGLVGGLTLLLLLWRLIQRLREIRRTSLVDPFTAAEAGVKALPPRMEPRRPVNIDSFIATQTAGKVPVPPPVPRSLPKVYAPPPRQHSLPKPPTKPAKQLDGRASKFYEHSKSPTPESTNENTNESSIVFRAPSPPPRSRRTTLQITVPHNSPLNPPPPFASGSPSQTQKQQLDAMLFEALSSGQTYDPTLTARIIREQGAMLDSLQRDIDQLLALQSAQATVQQQTADSRTLSSSIISPPPGYITPSSRGSFEPKPKRKS